MCARACVYFSIYFELMDGAGRLGDDVLPVAEAGVLASMEVGDVEFAEKV